MLPDPYEYEVDDEYDGVISSIDREEDSDEFDQDDFVDEYSELYF